MLPLIDVLWDESRAVQDIAYVSMLADLKVVLKPDMVDVLFTSPLANQYTDAVLTYLVDQSVRVGCEDKHFISYPQPFAAAAANVNVDDLDMYQTMSFAINLGVDGAHIVFDKFFSNTWSHEDLEDLFDTINDATDFPEVLQPFQTQLASLFIKSGFKDYAGGFFDFTFADTWFVAFDEVQAQQFLEIAPAHLVGDFVYQHHQLLNIEKLCETITDFHNRKYFADANQQYDVGDALIHILSHQILSRADAAIIAATTKIVAPKFYNISNELREELVAELIPVEHIGVRVLLDGKMIQHKYPFSITSSSMSHQGYMDERLPEILLRGFLQSGSKDASKYFWDLIVHVEEDTAVSIASSVPVSWYENIAYFAHSFYIVKTPSSLVVELLDILLPKAIASITDASRFDSAVELYAKRFTDQIVDLDVVPVAVLLKVKQPCPELAEIFVKFCDSYPGAGDKILQLASTYTSSLVSFEAMLHQATQ